MNRIPVDINAPNEPRKPFWERVTDTGSVGLAWSMLIHGILVIAMAFIFMPGITETKGFTVFATDAEESSDSFDSIVDVNFDESGASESTTEDVVELITETTDTMLQVTSIVETKAATESVGSGEGDSSGDGKGGARMRAPKNAVRQGSFAAWTVPIRQFRGETPKPGDSPRPGQHYYIVIELKLPENQGRYRVGDLAGTVMGTDGYELRLPNRTYFYNTDGVLEEATIRKRIPVIDGRVQLLVHVPGAKFEAVRDTIRVRSGRLAESQKLELIFKSS